MEVLSGKGFSRVDVLEAAAAVEIHSEHPIGMAIVNEANAEGIPVQDAYSFESESGFGVTGVVERHKVVIGNRSYLDTHRITVPEAVEYRGWDNKGYTTVFVGVGQDCIGSIAISDTIRASSKEAVTQFTNLGLNVLLISGDQMASAAEIGRLAGIENVIAGVKPQEKALLF